MHYTQSWPEVGTLVVCSTWIEAWNETLVLLYKGSMQSIKEFDQRFEGTQSLFNWIQVSSKS